MLVVPAGSDDYRAMEQDISLDDLYAAEGRSLGMPVHALWGSAGLPSRLPTLDIWCECTDDAIGAEIPDCGHFIRRSVQS